MSYSMAAQPIRSATVPARRSHVRDTVLAVVLFFAAIGLGATVLAPRAGGAATEPGCAWSCWESAI